MQENSNPLKYPSIGLFMSYSNISKEMKKFENYINTHAVTDVALKTTGHEGLKYNIVDLESDISKIRYVKKIEKNREKVYQFSYRKVNDSDLDK